MRRRLWDFGPGSGPRATLHGLDHAKRHRAWKPCSLDAPTREHRRYCPARSTISRTGAGIVRGTVGGPPTAPEGTETCVYGIGPAGINPVCSCRDGLHFGGHDRLRRADVAAPAQDGVDQPFVLAEPQGVLGCGAADAEASSQLTRGGEPFAWAQLAEVSTLTRDFNTLLHQAILRCIREISELHRQISPKAHCLHGIEHIHVSGGGFSAQHEWTLRNKAKPILNRTVQTLPLMRYRKSSQKLVVAYPCGLQP
ncbi:hypothetical protein GCM10023336_08130 [Streptomyces similanensis]|uniref:Uncharacterized protein n=1 Tax=Streptomyces similanensis TaxID=1274988 RepID=A0ABP9JWZ4_9ACTN